MAIQSFQLDPNAAAYSDDDIVGKVNAAAAQISRAGSVTAAARPIGLAEIGADELADGVVDNVHLAAGTAKASLDAMADTARGYIKTAPAAGEFKVVSVQRDSTGKLDVDFDDVAV